MIECVPLEAVFGIDGTCPRHVGRKQEDWRAKKNYLDAGMMETSSVDDEEFCDENVMALSETIYKAEDSDMLQRLGGRNER